MRIWQALKSAPRGYLADGRTLGLGLAVAMAKARQNPTADVEEYLRRRATEAPQRVSS